MSVLNVTMGAPIPRVIVSIDPGEHVGIVKLSRVETLGRLSLLTLHDATLRWPEDAEELSWWVDGADVVVIEEFRLFPGKAKAQTGSKFPAAEAIGWVRGLCLVDGITLVEQAAMVQHSMRNTDLAELVPRHQWPKGDHVLSAFKHLIHYLIKLEMKYQLEGED